MKFTVTDLQRAKNVLIALKRAKYDGLEGTEVLAFAQSFQWMNAFVIAMEKDVASQQQPQPPPTQPTPPTMTDNSPPPKKVIDIKEGKRVNKKKPRKK